MSCKKVTSILPSQSLEYLTVALKNIRGCVVNEKCFLFYKIRNIEKTHLIFIFLLWETQKLHFQKNIKLF